MNDGPNTHVPLVRAQAQLADALWAERGTVYLTGTQALLRILLMQRARDAAAGLNTQGFLSGYRGSPLGAVDQAVWKAGAQFAERGIRFLPAINEELGATAVLGTQRVQSDPEREADAVVGNLDGNAVLRHPAGQVYLPCLGMAGYVGQRLLDHAIDDRGYGTGR